MDGRNNQFNPQDTQNRQLVTVPPELGRIVQDGVTPEQFAENARQLEAYSRMNAMALQVYLQRQNQQAEQRRQYEFRLIQMAQQLASSENQQQYVSQQRQLQPQAQPPAPPPPHHRHAILAQQALASRNAPVIQSYGGVNTNNTASHWSYVDQPRAPNVQRQQQHPPVNTSSPFINSYPPRETNLGSCSTGGTGGTAASTLHAPQIYQPPKAVPNFLRQTPQHRRYSGASATSSQTNTGHAGAPGGSTNQGVHNSYGGLNELYPQWVRAYGDVKAASMAREHMQSWKQGTQIQPTVAVPVHSTVAPPTISMSVQNLQHPSQFQIRESEGAPPPPHPPAQGWTISPVASTHGQQAWSQFHPAAPLNHPPSLQTPTNGFTSQTNTLRSAQNTRDAYIRAEVPTHHLDATADSPVVTSTDPAPTITVPPSSQPSSTQSILLASEEKGTALYTMRGLAASIKRSLNAERLAASREPSASDSPGQKRKPIEVPKVVDPEPKAEPQPDLVTEPLPVSLTQVPISHQEETMDTANGLQIPSSQHDPSRNFIPFSTLTGAVSFDDSVPVNQNPAPSPEATGVLEDLTTSSQSIPQPDVLLNHIEDSFIPVSQPSYDPFSFPHRTPTPPLAATITTVHDESEIDEKVASISSPHPSTDLHEIEIDSQLQLIPSGNEDDIEMNVAPGGDHVQTQLNIASSELSHALDNDTLMQEADVSSDPSIGIDRTSIECSIVEDSEGETRRSTRPSEELAGVLPRTSPIRVQSLDLAETSGPSSLPKLPRKSRRKQEFYIAVPPASEWVLRAKDREAERKALMRERAGENNNREYTEYELANRLCLRHCHWSGCQAVLNSMYALKRHVRQHQLEVKPVGPAMTVSCRWKQCRMVCNQSSLILHLIRHIDKGVPCIYDDCDERFSRIQDLSKHEKSVHANDEPPPSAIPRPPELRSPVALPQTVPSYTTTTRPACKPSINAERHARLGPWTLGMIIGHPTAGSDWANTALHVRRTTRLTDKALNIVPTPMLLSKDNNGEISPKSEFLRQSAEYDILEEPSVASSRKFGELDTVELTGELYEGSVRGGTPVTESDSAMVEALL